MKKLYQLGLATVLLLGLIQSPLFSAQAVTSAPVWPVLELQLAASGLSSPVYLTYADHTSGRLFIVEQGGQVRILKNGALLSTPFLDIHTRVLFSGERGLLSIAFPPDFAAKMHFYVYYTQLDGNNRIARFSLSSNPDVADPASEQLVLEFSHPTYSNHNGGQLAFGPDGFLYVGTGDGGGGGDPFGNAQNPASLLGKLLRLDVESGSATYSIPANNPYVRTSGYRGEIWALGLRNPWRFSFDSQTHNLFIADVGQDREEEIDFQSATSTGGENYGWNILEGVLCYPSGNNCPPPAHYSAPVWTYDHGTNDSIGCSITGGYVYRGSAYPRMNGIYFYSDYCTGTLWGLQPVSGSWQNKELLKTGANISSFGQDPQGEVYLMDYGNGSIYHLTDLQANVSQHFYLPVVSR